MSGIFRRSGHEQECTEDRPACRARDATPDPVRLRATSIFRNARDVRIATRCLETAAQAGRAKPVVCRCELGKARGRREDG